jgi:molybdopterin-guanine dinucleotide biosynthesis protein A
MSSASWDAVVLAGGAARRMGGRDKLRLDVGGQPMLDRVLAAAGGAGRIVVVGPQRATAQPVTWCREDPPGGGPAAALAAALRVVTAPLVVVLAGDQPLLTAALVDRLRGSVTTQGAVAVTPDGSVQWLCSAWRADALRAADLHAGGSLRAAVAPLDWTPVRVGAEDVFDCDTLQDLARARELSG